jgi:hypothetical protein
LSRIDDEKSFIFIYRPATIWFARWFAPNAVWFARWFALRGGTLPPVRSANQITAENAGVFERKEEFGLRGA